MKENSPASDALKLPSRWFSFQQLSKISEENHGVFNVNMIMSSYCKSDLFILTPAIKHGHASGNPVEPHIRAYVTKFLDDRLLGLQDLTFEQWEQGEEI